MAKSDGLFGVALFLMGAAAAASSMSIIVVNVMFPAVILYQIVSVLDFVVSIVAIVASKKYGPKALISSAAGKYFTLITSSFRIFFILLIFFLLKCQDSTPSCAL